MDPIILTILVLLGLGAIYGLILFLLSRKIEATQNELVKSKLMQALALVNGGFACLFLFYITGVIVHTFNLGGQLSLNVAITIIISWLVILVGYYSWAIYFFNINLGWSDERWHRQRNLQSETGETTDRNENPNHEETLGLPPGTVRGTIALTLLVIGSALAIASFGFDKQVALNTEFIDNFEFMKTAFLMMIAFYFGTKSLEWLKPAGGKANKSQSGNAAVQVEKKKDLINDPAIQKELMDPNAMG